MAHIVFLPDGTGLEPPASVWSATCGNHPRPSESAGLQGSPAGSVFFCPGTAAQVRLTQKIARSLAGTPEWPPHPSGGGERRRGWAAEISLPPAVMSQRKPLVSASPTRPGPQDILPISGSPSHTTSPLCWQEGTSFVFTPETHSVQPIKAEPKRNGNTLASELQK